MRIPKDTLDTFEEEIMQKYEKLFEI